MSGRTECTAPDWGTLQNLSACGHEQEGNDVFPGRPGARRASAARAAPRTSDEVGGGQPIAPTLDCPPQALHARINWSLGGPGPTTSRPLRASAENECREIAQGAFAGLLIRAIVRRLHCAPYSIDREFACNHGTGHYRAPEAAEMALPTAWRTNRRRSTEAHERVTEKRGVTFQFEKKRTGSCPKKEALP